METRIDLIDRLEVELKIKNDQIERLAYEKQELLTEYKRLRHVIDGKDWTISSLQIELGKRGLL